MIKLASLFGAFAFCFAIPAIAQEDDQGVIDAYLAQWNGGEGLKLLGHLANCVAKKHPEAADAFVRETVDATALQRDQARLIDPDCIKKYWFRSSSTSVDPTMYRLMLAEALLTVAYTDTALPAVNAVTEEVDRAHLPNVPIDEVHPYYRTMFIIDHHGSDLAAYSGCVARQRPEAVLALASTSRNTVEERLLLPNFRGRRRIAMKHGHTFLFLPMSAAES